MSNGLSRMISRSLNIKTSGYRVASRAEKSKKEVSIFAQFLLLVQHYDILKYFSPSGKSKQLK